MTSPITTPVSEKACRICHEVKPLTDFYNAKTSADGKDSKCRYCAVRLSMSKFDPLAKRKFTDADNNAYAILMHADHLQVLEWALDGVPAKSPAPVGDAYTWRGVGRWGWE